jgi:hypothetical protein
LKACPAHWGKNLINPATAWTDMHSVDPQWLVEFEMDAIIPD